MTEQRFQSDIRIRLAVAADAAAMATVLHAAFVEYECAYTPQAFTATTPTSDQIRARLEEGPAWVAEHDNALVGTVAAVARGDVLYIRSMAILPPARGQGIGARLFEQIEQYAAAQGYTYLMLSTTPFLIRAIRLYERLGFRRSDEGPRELFGTPLFTMVMPLQRAV